MEPDNEFDKKPVFERMCFVVFQSMKWPAILFQSYRTLINTISREDSRKRATIFSQYLNLSQQDNMNRNEKSGEAIAFLIGDGDKVSSSGYTILIQNMELETADFMSTYMEYSMTRRFDDMELKGALDVSISYFQKSFKEGNNTIVTTSKRTSSVIEEKTNEDNNTIFTASKKSSSVTKVKGNNSQTAIRVSPPTEKPQHFSSKEPECNPVIEYVSVASSVEDTSICENDSWLEVWEKLKAKGWRCQNSSGLQTSYYYIPPGGSVDGVDNKDFFSHEKLVKSYVRKKYAWRAEPEPSPILAVGSRKRRRSSKANENDNKKKHKNIKSTITRQARSTNYRDSSTTKVKKAKTTARSTHKTETPNSKKKSATPSFSTENHGSKVAQLEQVGDDYSMESEQIVYDHLLTQEDPLDNEHTENFPRPEGSVAPSTPDDSSIDSNFVPEFSEVWNILVDRLNFKEENNLYLLPNVSDDDEKSTSPQEGVNTFATSLALQHYLAANGIPGNEDDVTKEELRLLECWIRLSHLSIIYEERFKTNLSLNKKNDQIYSIVKKRGFKYKQGIDIFPSMYLFPEVTIPKTKDFMQFKQFKGRLWVEDLSDLKESFCRFGIPGNDDEDKHILALWAKDCNLKIFVERKVEASRPRRKSIEKSSEKISKPKSAFGNPKKRGRPPKKSIVVKKQVKSVITDVSSVTNTIATAKTSLASKSRRDSLYEEVEPEIVYGNREAWDVLREQLKFRFTKNLYVLPDTTTENMVKDKNAFASLEALRLHLLHKKIPVASSPVYLEEDIKLRLSRWLAYTHVPKDPPSVRALSDKEAWKILCKRGFSHRNGYYILPGRVLPRTEELRMIDIDKGYYFAQLSSIHQWCCLNGVPKLEVENDIDDWTCLALWAACFPLKIFRENLEDENSHQRYPSRTPSNSTRKRRNSSVKKSQKQTPDDCSSIQSSIITFEVPKDQARRELFRSPITERNRDKIGEDNESVSEVEASVANDDGYPTDDNFSAADITQHIREKIGQDSDSASEVEANVANDDGNPTSRSFSAVDDTLITKEGKLGEDNCTPPDENRMNDENKIDEISIKAHLETCISRLQLTFDTTANRAIIRRFQTEETSEFLKKVVKKWGFTTLSEEEDNHRLLHLCGAPGTGKTTTARECISEIVEWAKNSSNQKEILSSAVKNDWDPIPSICMLNGSHVTANSQTELQRQFATIIGNEVDTSTSPCLDLIEKQLSVCHKTQKTKQKTVILIIDEIDLVLSAPGAVPVLDRLFRWCLSPTHAFTIVCISNVVTCKWMSKFSSIDGLKENFKKVVFPAYDRDGLINIVRERIGHRTFDKGSLELAGRKIASVSGDARAMLTLATRAIAVYQESLDASTEPKMICPSNMEPLVSLRHMMKAVRETVGKKHADIIEGLPQAAKFVLCITMAIGSCLAPGSYINQGTLKRYCAAAARGGFLEHLSMEHFTEILDLLIDSGLLNVGSERHLNNAHERRLWIGIQLDDVECAMEKTLLQQKFFQDMIAHAKKELSNSTSSEIDQS